MTSDEAFILVDGTVMSRDDVANSLDGAPGWEGYEISDVQKLSSGTDAAALIYRAPATSSDLHEPLSAIVSTTY